MTKTNEALHRVDLIALGYGAILCAGAYFIFGFEAFRSVLVGVAVAQGNWTVFRRVGLKVAASGNKSRLMAFVGIKFVLILGLIALILATRIASPLPFMVGISSLMLGVFTHSGVQSMIDDPQDAKIEDKEPPCRTE